MPKNARKVIVVGGGLGGLAAAIRLRADGHEVVVVERNERAGGRMNQRSAMGFTFDTGPSALTMPWVLEQLFASAGRNLSDYVKLVRIEPQWRAFYEDGTRLDLSGSDLSLGARNDRERQQLLRYLGHARKLYELSLKSVYKYSLNSRADLRQHHSLKERLAIDLRRSAAQTTARYIDDGHMRQFMDYMLRHAGMPASAAPAFMTHLAFAQLGLGLYYIEGGMYSLASALLKLLDELGVEVRTNTEAASILVDRGAAAGVKLRGGEWLLADAVVCNQDVRSACESLLADHPQQKQALHKLEAYEPSVSVFALMLGVNRTYPEMRHHNLFLSADPELEVRRIFDEKQAAEDPTVYVSISAKSDRTQAPEGKENWFVLTHVPPLTVGESWTHRRDYYRNLVLDKLERMGATGLRQAIEIEFDLIPDDLRAQYGTYGGSAYGVDTDRNRGGGFKIACRSQIVDSLYFVGASTHPGASVAMVALSGQLAADLVRNDVAAREVVMLGPVRQIGHDELA
ncbi:diapolycopene oxygenase [Paenibacillus phyllosphaerae]|uniref:4,4'-diaponeurosporene oxygenase n=1 Tax=Paenibacillus phyllosphaerae TaxID=274593 RepID=A0A7W5AVD9_9BACL|nr:phytoene desaturase family protein [Paenibacillus phyllosphaerae]MBB3109500.1 diapolycopene oxygenase [Paenibacillus phyllosphaerae]